MKLYSADWELAYFGCHFMNWSSLYLSDFLEISIGLSFGFPKEGATQIEQTSRDLLASLPWVNSSASSTLHTLLFYFISAFLNQTTELRAFCWLYAWGSLLGTKLVLTESQENTYPPVLFLSSCVPILGCS